MAEIKSYFIKLFQLAFVRIYLSIELATRVILVIYSLAKEQINFSEIISSLLVGLLNDFISLCYVLPVIVFFSLIFRKLFSRVILLNLSYAAYFLIINILLLNSISELVFWDEFGTRFNFIAVDYLIYTHEIIGTLKESLPVLPIIIGLFILSGVILIFIKNFIAKQIDYITLKQQAIYIVSLCFFDIFAFTIYDSQQIQPNYNNYSKELAKNGLYEFFSAFNNNSLDFNKFYNPIEDDKALAIVRSNLSLPNQRFLNINNIDRQYKSFATKIDKSQKYNVILIVVESLSAEFMSYFGNTNGVTPYLDELVNKSLFFTRLYATGTRTVRGLEAITLSVPPTPGSSIIRRSNNQSLFNIGSIFKEQGYEIDFIFGGYSYFDNLRNYFTGNGYNITERSDLKSEEISFANIWGVADEDILSKTLEKADYYYKVDKSFFSLVLTTSNHRPYTFPSGRIDLPSGGGRLAAVKYTDYAIANFIENAKKRPWFKNTIFVITADHCASSAGKTELPINKYHIPLIIYAPSIVTPKKIDNLASQIDIAPTLLELALPGYSYQTKFFGQDILHAPQNRAFIGTYQLLGYVKNDNLVILAPNAKPVTYRLFGHIMQKTNNLPSLVEEATSFYQTAYNLYIHGDMKKFGAKK